jgi:hypothetical protein
MKVVKPTALTAAMLISTTAAEAYGAWNAGTAYALDAFVIRTTTNHVYQCIQGPSTGNTPETSPLYWTDKGPTNTWAMFDSQISTQSVATSSLSVVVKPGLCNSICLFGLVGATLTVTVRDGLAGPVVYTRTVTLDGTVITDWYQYYFEPSVQLTSVVLSDLPPYGNAHITATVSGTGSVKCGTLLLGTFYELGDVQLGATSGITDYSRKDTDAFGVVTFVQRPYSDRIGVDLIFMKSQLNKVKSILASVRATPCAWIGTDASGFEVLNTLGFYKDFSIVIAYPTRSLCSLEIEGLT